MLERPAPHTLTAAAGSQRPRRALRDSFARPAAPTRQLEDVLGAAARGGGSDLHVRPLLQLGHEAPRRPRELELEVSEERAREETDSTVPSTPAQILFLWLRET